MTEVDSCNKVDFGWINLKTTLFTHNCWASALLGNIYLLYNMNLCFLSLDSTHMWSYLTLKWVEQLSWEQERLKGFYVGSLESCGERWLSVCMSVSSSISWRDNIHHSAVCFWEIWRALNHSWERGVWSLNENQVYNRKIRRSTFYSALPCGRMDGFLPGESIIVEHFSCRCETNVAPSWIFSPALSIWSTDVLQIIFIVRLR